MNNIIAAALELWLESMNTSVNPYKWITENQMWIYPLNSNYVIYSKPKENHKFSLEIFLAEEDITIIFKNQESIYNFIKKPVIAL